MLYNDVADKASHLAGTVKVNGDTGKVSDNGLTAVTMDTVAVTGGDEVKVELNTDTLASSLNIGFMGSKDDVIPGLDLPVVNNSLLSGSTRLNSSSAMSWDDIVGMPSTKNALPPVTVQSQTEIAPSAAAANIERVGGTEAEEEDEYDDEDSLGPLEMAIIKQKDLRLLPNQSSKSHGTEDAKATGLQQLPDTSAGLDADTAGGLVWSPLDQDTGLAGAAVTLPAAEPMFSDSDEEKADVDTSTSVSGQVLGLHCVSDN